jgi:hypothetical protein
MAYVYDLTPQNGVSQYSSAWFAVFIRYQNNLSFDRSLTGVQNNKSGKSVSIPDLNATQRQGAFNNRFGYDFF